MGRYVNVVARPECVSQINELYSKAFPGKFLVYDRNQVEKEVRWCQTKGPEHLRYITTAELWNESFPIHAEGRGQIFIESDRTKKRTAELKAQVEWVMANRMLFDSVSGLQDADELGIAIEPQLDGYARGVKVMSKQPSFDALPVESEDPVYQLAKRFDRADLWEAYCRFRTTNSLENWKELRCKVVPGGTAMLTVWQRAEALEFERSGKSYGLIGKYNTSVPTRVWVEYSILVSEGNVLAIRESQRPLRKK